MYYTLTGVSYLFPEVLIFWSYPLLKELLHFTKFMWSCSDDNLIISEISVNLIGVS